MPSHLTLATTQSGAPEVRNERHYQHGWPFSMFFFSFFIILTVSLGWQWISFSRCSVNNTFSHQPWFVSATFWLLHIHNQPYNRSNFWCSLRTHRSKNPIFYFVIHANWKKLDSLLDVHKPREITFLNGIVNIEFRFAIWDHYSKLVVLPKSERPNRFVQINTAGSIRFRLSKMSKHRYVEIIDWQKLFVQSYWQPIFFFTVLLNACGKTLLTVINWISICFLFCLRSEKVDRGIWYPIIR